MGVQQVPQVFNSPRINLSPFTKDFRVLEPFIEPIPFLSWQSNKTACKCSNFFTLLVNQSCFYFEDRFVDVFVDGMAGPGAVKRPYCNLEKIQNQSLTSRLKSAPNSSTIISQQQMALLG